MPVARVHRGSNPKFPLFQLLIYFFLSSLLLTKSLLHYRHSDFQLCANEGELFRKPRTCSCLRAIEQMEWALLTDTATADYKHNADSESIVTQAKKPITLFLRHAALGLRRSLTSTCPLPTNRALFFVRRTSGSPQNKPSKVCALCVRHSSKLFGVD